MRMIFRVHAIQRMFARNISKEEVLNILETGKAIEDYPNDKPYPSRLILGWCENRPLHVVAAYNAEAKQVIVVTVYDPDPNQWEIDFRRRKNL